MLDNCDKSLMKHTLIAWTRILYDEGMIDRAKYSRMLASFNKIRE